VKRARLVLARETLSRLGPDDLADVHGGSLSYPTCPTVHTGMTRCTVCDVDIALTGLCNSIVSCFTCPCA
jgi:hypothetical protein